LDGGPPAAGPSDHEDYQKYKELDPHDTRGVCFDTSESKSVAIIAVVKDTDAQ